MGLTQSVQTPPSTPPPVEQEDLYVSPKDQSIHKGCLRKEDKDAIIRACKSLVATRQKEAESYPNCPEMPLSNEYDWIDVESDPQLLEEVVNSLFRDLVSLKVRTFTEQVFVNSCRVVPQTDGWPEYEDIYVSKTITRVRVYINKKEIKLKRK